MTKEIKLRKKSSNAWHITVTLSCVIIAVLILLFLFLYRQVGQVSDTSKELSQNQVDSMGEQVSNLYGNYGKICDILAANSAFSRYASHSASMDEEIMVRDGHQLRKDMMALLNVYGESISTLAIYFTASDSVVTMSRQLLSGETVLFFQDYPEITPEELENLNLSTVGGTHFLYENGHNWIIRRVLETDTESAYILLEYRLTKAITRMTANTEGMLVLVGNSEECLYSNDEIPKSEDYIRILDEATTSGMFTFTETYFAQHRVLTPENIHIISAKPATNLIRIRNQLNTILVISVVLVTVSLFLLLRSLKNRVFTPLESLIHSRRGIDMDTKTAIQTISEDIDRMENAQIRLLRERDYLLPSALGRNINRIAEYSKDSQNIVRAESCLSMANVPPGHGFALFSILRLEDKNNIFSGLGTQGASRLGTLYYFLDNVLKDILFTTYSGMVAPVRTNLFTVLVKCPTENDCASVEAAAQQLIKFYNEHFSVTLSTTGVHYGTTPEDFIEIVFAQSHELSLLNFWGDSKTEPLEEEKTGSAGFSMYYNMIRKEIGSLNLDNYDSVWEKLDGILIQALPMDSNIRNTKYRISAITTFIITAIEEQVSGEREFIEAQRFEERLYEADSIIDYRTEMKKVLLELVEHKDLVDKSVFIYGRMEDIRKYLLSHFTENSLSVAAVAKEFGISTSYLSRSFKSTFDMNLLEFIQRLRVESAKRLLSGEMPIQDIARQVGFWDTQSLTRAFKKIEGLTPLDYRRLIKKERDWE